MDLSFLSESIGKFVCLERGGPDKLEGILRSIMADCLAVETKDEGVTYVQVQHIKTISEPIVTEIQLTRNEPTDLYAPVLEKAQPPLLEATDFNDLLQKMSHRLVRVNHGGPNSLQGVLMDIRPDVITILHDMKDCVHYPIYHIKSIMWVYKTRDKQTDQSQNNLQSGGRGKD